MLGGLRSWQPVGLCILVCKLRTLGPESRLSAALADLQHPLPKELIQAPSRICQSETATSGATSPLLSAKRL